MRIKIADLIKIFTIYMLLYLSESKCTNIELIVLVITIASIDRCIYDFIIKKRSKKIINWYNLFIGFIVFNIYYYIPWYLLLFFASWIVYDFISE